MNGELQKFKIDTYSRMADIVVLKKDAEDLQDKIDVLDALIKSSAFQTISTFQQNLMQIQLGAMRVYVRVINERITDLEGV